MNSDFKYTVLIILFSAIAIVLSKIPQLNPPDMYKRELTLKGALKLFLIALGIFIIIMVLLTGFLMLSLNFKA